VPIPLVAEKKVKINIGVAPLVIGGATKKDKRKVKLNVKETGKKREGIFDKEVKKYTHMNLKRQREKMKGATDPANYG
jgi:hypothetical protein